MTLIECPACKKGVDVDAKNIRKTEDGTDLIVSCPACSEKFVVARIAQVRRKLMVAEAGLVRDRSGKHVRIDL